ncbi:phosphoglycerate kinase [Candidatus Woesearchaeota archaeon]|nr:phosphoglycerate kinase [Candidatus Woesearchaeota archaeon]
MHKFFTLNDLDFKGKNVIVRAAFDVPLDASKKLLDSNRVRDDSRIRDVVPTLSYLIKNNCKIILAAGWVGRPKGEDPELSMAPVALKLQEILKEENVLKHDVLLTPNCLDGSKPRSVYRNKEEVLKDILKLKGGQMILLENVRYDDEANANDLEFAKFIASLVGRNAVYVNEAEAQNHRPEATVSTVPKIVVENGGKAAFGFKMADVIKYMGNLSNVLSEKERGAFIFFLSGKKIETQVGITSKISVTHSLLNKMRKNDVIVVQGAVTYTFLLAGHYIGEIENKIENALHIISQYNKKQDDESKRIKKENKDASALITEMQAKFQKEKSDKLKELINISDDDIKKLIGNSFVEWKEIGEQIIFAAEVLLKARQKNVEVLLNSDHTITNHFPDKYGNLPKEAEIKSYNSAAAIPSGWLGVAPGPKTLQRICDKVKSSYLLILAGPLSIEDERVENFSSTNRKLFEAVREAKDNGAITIGAGGDTAAIIRQWKGEDAFTVISNAGGATLELIEKDGKLPGIEVIEESYKKFNR